MTDKKVLRKTLLRLLSLDDLKTRFKLRTNTPIVKMNEILNILQNEITFERNTNLHEYNALRKQAKNNDIPITKKTSIKKLKQEIKQPVSAMITVKYFRREVGEKSFREFDSIKYLKNNDMTYVNIFNKLYEHERHSRLKTKIFLVKTTNGGLEQSYKTLSDRLMKQLGGVQYHKIIFRNVVVGTEIAKHTSMTVPLRAANACQLKLFNESGDLIVENIDEGNNTCVIDFLYENLVKKFARKFRGNGRFPYISKEDIHKQIDSLWILKCNDPSNSFGNDIQYCEPFDDFNKYDSKIHGVNLLQLSLWCYEKQVSLKCLDTDLKIFHQYKSNRTGSVHSLNIIVDNGHIYNIVDPKLRKSIQNSGRGGSVHMNILDAKNEKNKTTINPDYAIISVKNPSYSDIVNIPDNTNIFITGKEDLEKLYIDMWANENAKYAYKSHSNLMTQIHLKAKHIFYNPEYDQVVDVCKNLNIAFNNQSLISIGLDIFKSVNPKISLDTFSSQFNTETRRFFECLRRDNWVTSYQNGKGYAIENISSVDICKCYSSILQDKTNNWMRFNTLDEVKVYTGEQIMSDAFYFVDANEIILFQGKGVYIGDIVKIGLEDGLIQPSDIKFYIESLNITTTNVFEKFVNEVYNMCGINSKYIINTFIGNNLGKTMKSVGKLKYTDDLNSASVAYFDSKNELNVFVKGKSVDNLKTLYAIDDTKTETLVSELFTLHGQIIQKTYLKVYNMMKANNVDIRRDLIAVKTDNIIYIGPIICELGIKLGDYRKEEINQSTLNRIVENKADRLYYASGKNFNKLNPKFTEINITDEYDITEILEKTKDKDVLLLGRAGVGKSYVLRALYDEMISRGEVVKCASFTHKAKKHLPKGATTLHKLFGLDVNGKRSHKTSFKNITRILLDEISMMPQIFYDAIISAKQLYPKIRFTLCGDFNQLQPVKEEHIDFQNSRILYDICPNRLTLKINKRVQDKGQEFFEIMEKVLNNEAISLPSINEPLDLNLCYYNKTRKRINRKLMIKYRGDTYKTIPLIRNHDLKNGNHQAMYIYAGLPIICKGGKNIGDLTNGDLLSVVSYDENEVIMKLDYDGSISTIKFNTLFSLSFHPAYCLTIHSAQGDTIDRPYAIYDFENFPSVNMAYTALSRSTKLEHIFIGSSV